MVGLTDAAKEIGLSRERLRQIVHEGGVRFQRVGRSIGIPRSEIRRLKSEPRPKGGWPKGKPRKPPTA